jgi:secretion/DNA translocation related TadE-like protein
MLCRLREDRGSGTLLVALGCVVVTMVATAGMVLASVLVVRTRVAAAADLGALAAASAILQSEASACARARVIVQGNGAALRTCRVDGAQARIEVVGQAPAAVTMLTGGRTAWVHARAHAELLPSAGQ